MALSDEMRIDVIPNGPYMVRGNVPLLRVKIVVENGDSVAFKETYRYPLQETYALCRCGESKNKPFCDGAHVAAGFEGKRLAPHSRYIDEAEDFQGDGITLLDAPRLCIGARFCDRAGGVWNLTEDSADPDARKIAISEAELCPSGRLTMVEDASHSAFEIEYEPSIALIEDPYGKASSAIWVRGGIPIFDEQGEQLDIRNRVTLCRCGKSRDIRFCDGTHYQVRFNDGHLHDDVE